MFIAVEVDDQAAADAALAKKLTEACPVDIFAQTRRRHARDRRPRTSTSACSAACAWTPPPGVVKVIKLYDGDAAL